MSVLDGYLAARAVTENRPVRRREKNHVVIDEKPIRLLVLGFVGERFYPSLFHLRYDGYEEAFGVYDYADREHFLHRFAAFAEAFVGIVRTHRARYRTFPQVTVPDENARKVLRYTVREVLRRRPESEELAKNAALLTAYLDLAEGRNSSLVVPLSSAVREHYVLPFSPFYPDNLLPLVVEQFRGGDDLADRLRSFDPGSTSTGPYFSGNRESAIFAAEHDHRERRNEAKTAHAEGRTRVFIEPSSKPLDDLYAEEAQAVNGSIDLLLAELRQATPAPGAMAFRATTDTDDLGRAFDRIYTEAKGYPVFRGARFLARELGRLERRAERVEATAPFEDRYALLEAVHAGRALRGTVTAAGPVNDRGLDEWRIELITTDLVPFDDTDDLGFGVGEDRFRRKHVPFTLFSVTPGDEHSTVELRTPKKKQRKTSVVGVALPEVDSSVAIAAFPTDFRGATLPYDLPWAITGKAPEDAVTSDVDGDAAPDPTVMPDRSEGAIASNPNDPHEVPEDYDPADDE